MNFLRKLFFPFSLLYGSITWLRNWMYDNDWLKSKSYNLPIICVGNLSTGGTGKSPMIEFLISFLKDSYGIAVLSRGYKRKTTGYKEVLASSTVMQVGDEPLQFKRKFPEVTVAVCEDRQTGIEKLNEHADIILLDDAFQHRKVRASLNILLTPFDHLYVDDFVLPAGNLRESRFGAKRADIIVVTKCPDDIENSSMDKIGRRLKLKPHQSLCFTGIGYSEKIHGKTESLPLEFLKDKTFLLITGIANPKPLVKFLKQENLTFTHRSFPDHHNFSTAEIVEISKNKLILTTEKDYMRLENLGGQQAIYYLPIQTKFLNSTENEFKKCVSKHIQC